MDIDIIDEPQPDGSVIGGAAWCSREKVGNWECEYGSGRGYDMTVLIAGQSRKLWTNIPEKISVEAATRMMQQAIDIAPGLTMDNVCDFSLKVDQKTDPPWLAALEEIHRYFQFSTDQPYAHIVDWGNYWSMWVGDNEMDFEPAADGADGFKFKCWSISFSVT